MATEIEKVIVRTNDFTCGGSSGYKSLAVAEVDEALAEGKAVRVSADCIGHTRAAMVEASARNYFEAVGAVEVERDGVFGGSYYALPHRG